MGTPPYRSLFRVSPGCTSARLRQGVTVTKATAKWAAIYPRKSVLDEPSSDNRSSVDGKRE